MFNLKIKQLHFFLSSSASLDKYTLFTESLSPELRLEAEYNLNGRILLLPIQGQGPCTITLGIRNFATSFSKITLSTFVFIFFLVNAKLNHTIIGEPFEKKGKKYIKIVDYIVSIVPEKMTFKFDNLFNGDQRLGDEINKVLNENWDAIFNDVKPSYDQTFGLIFKDLANRVFTRVPFNEIFLE